MLVCSYNILFCTKYSLTLKYAFYALKNYVGTSVHTKMNRREGIYRFGYAYSQKKYVKT